MRPSVRRAYIVGGLLLFTVLGAALFSAEYFRSNVATFDATTKGDNGAGSLRLAPAHDGDIAKIEPSQRVLGNYPDTSISLSSGTTVTPDAPPINITGISVSTSTNFNGVLTGDPTTGVVRVTNAKPPGTYTVTIRAFNAAQLTATRTFRLTVLTPATCPAVNFAATNFGVGTGAGAEGLAVGDFNGDGRQDLAVANGMSARVSILFGDGTGHFSDPNNIGLGGPRAIAVGDFNGDGKQDLAVATGNGAAILLGDGAGHFGAPTNFVAGGIPVSVAIGDFNGDGKQDLAVANRSSDDVSILLGDGAGNFSQARNFHTGADPEWVAIGDFNDDGKQDLAVANYDSNTVSILFGDGLGNFSAATDFAVGVNPQSLATGDFNGDGNQDLAVANRGCTTAGTVSILLGNGEGNFTNAGNVPTGFGPFSIAVADFNSDGNQDLATANYCSNPGAASVLLGNGTGHFSAPTEFMTGGFQPVSVAVGDFDGDGKQDFAVVNFIASNVSVMIHNCTPAPTPTPTPTPITPTPTPTPTATPSPFRSCPPLITQSTSQTVLPGNSQFPCVNGHIHNGQTDNSYWRAFNMQIINGRRQYNVSSVSFGVQHCTGPLTVLVRLYTNSGAPFPGGTRTLIGQSPVAVDVSQGGTIVEAPLLAAVPAGTSELIMELFTPASLSIFFIGSNQSPETGPSYWSAPCTSSVPTVTSMHIILNVLGSCPAATPTPSPTATPPDLTRRGGLQPST